MRPSEISISRWVFFVTALSVVSAWPMLLISAPLVFFDTFAYLGMGEQTLAIANAILMAPSGGTGGGSEGAEGVRAVRAVSYSVYLYLTSKTALGLALPVVSQTALTLTMFWPFIRKVDWQWQSCLALGVLVAFSTFPWIASYAMPDILAAAVIIWVSILVRSLDELSWMAVASLTIIASFAVSSHYGHIPLGLLLTVFALSLRLIQKRVSLRFMLVAPIPVLAALILNLSASAIALNEPSVAPKRLPILLARSLEDGPAAWYLKDHCQGSSFAMCEAFADNIPQNISEFLWKSEGISSISTDTLNAIRAEEMAFLIATFKQYPAAQTWSFVGNVARQIVTVGTDDLYPIDEFSVGKIDSFQASVLDPFDWITKAATLFALFVILILWRRGSLSRHERDLALMIIVGLIVNAVIFGGMSAPVDRYQSRVAWLLPALWFIHAAQNRRT